MMMSDNFVTLDNIVSSILVEIGDESNKRYAIRARQWALDEYRRVNVNLSNVYLERKVELDENNFCEKPEGCMKLISVGVYRSRNGQMQFDPFVKVSGTSIRAEDISDETYNSATEPTQQEITARGGYWVDDLENGGFYVRSYRDISGTISDVTSNIANRIIIRFRTTGLNLGGDIFIPYEAKDYITAAVALKFKRMNIPVRLTNAALQQETIQMDIYRQQYLDLIYEPGSLYEVKDAIFGRT